jgi:NhaP-type Na+/H+ and K+/H+ antiporter
MDIELKPRSTVGFLGSRGAVGVVIAATALSASLIGVDIYSLLLFGTIVLAVFFPLLIKGEKVEGDSGQVT